MSVCARYWMIDLHTHTPASLDVSRDRYGATTPEEFVAAAIAAGLDAIAVTDHNTTEWCDSVRASAADQALLVLPGVEISTSEGHLLAIFDEDMPGSRIDEILVLAGIRSEDRGRLDIATEKGIAEVAHLVCDSGGLAIAAHVDAPRGLLELQVAAHVKRLLCDPSLAALEVVDLASCEGIQRRVRGDRQLSFVRGSDATTAGVSGHRVAGLGSRRTWIKSGRPDLVGIAHALRDPSLRVRLEMPPPSSHPVIESLSIESGFLGGLSLRLSPELNCLLGGTGAGKSLVLEALRYVLDQQVDGQQFPAIWAEVESRLKAAIGNDGVVRAEVLVGEERYSFERVVNPALDGVVTARRILDGTWVEVDASPVATIPIQAFSQGEALEYSRQPVGRMRLVDAGLDLSGYDAQEFQLTGHLRSNADELLAQRAAVGALEVLAISEATLSERVLELSAFFEGDVATAQQSWATEARRMNALRSVLPSEETLRHVVEVPARKPSIVGNDDLSQRADEVLRALSRELASSSSDMIARLHSAEAELQAVQTEFAARHAAFKQRLDQELQGWSQGHPFRPSGRSWSAIKASWQIRRRQGRDCKMSSRRDSLS
jgi:PHP family Zn ribbon phosphoesterase